MSKNAISNKSTLTTEIQEDSMLKDEKDALNISSILGGFFPKELFYVFLRFSVASVQGLQ